MKQFYLSLSKGIFPVSWVDGVANYGYPLGQINQQFTNYLGALFFFPTQNIYLANNLVAFIGAYISLVIFYRLLRFYVEPVPALTASFLFNFAPYRIMNIYIRGALPEFFSSLLIGLILLSLTYWLKNKKYKWYGILLISIAGLALTHPLMLVISFPLISIYAAFLLKPLVKNSRKIFLLITSYIWAFGIAAYYMLPLNMEVKYFYYGESGHQNASFQFMSLNQFLHERWGFFEPGSPGVRENRPQLGIIEAVIIGLSIIYTIWHYLRYKKVDALNLALLFSFAVGIIISLPISNVLWQHLPGLAKIQHPWRMLTMLSFTAPFLLALMLTKLKFRQVLSVVVVICISLLRFPQLYGKNYILFPQDRYDFAVINMHNTIMNTIWSGNTLDYPVKPKKYEIIEGQGKFLSTSVLPTKRTYTVNAESPVRLIDYTFYYPGWRLYVDNTEQQIEFQDPNYRGVITYRLPQGVHNVELNYTDTKVRRIGKLLSVSSSIFLITWYLFLKRFKTYQKIWE